MSTNPPSQIELDPEHLDDILYLVRVNEAEELRETIDLVSKQQQCSQGEVLKRSVDPQSGNSVLHYSAANGFNDLTTFLLQSIQASSTTDTSATAAFINHQNLQGNTALHWASLNGHLAIVQQLITAGADMWLKNLAGHLAMFEAERAEKSDVVQYLLQAGGKEVERTGHEAEEDGDVIHESSADNDSRRTTEDRSQGHHDSAY